MSRSGWRICDHNRSGGMEFNLSFVVGPTLVSLKSQRQAEACRTSHGLKIGE